MKAGRRIAFDYGDVRIGVAISDLSGLLATPYEAIINSENTFNEIDQLVKENEPLYFAVGIPRHLSGSTSAKMESVELFIGELDARFSIPIVRIDERLTTVSASKSLQSAGKNAKQSKGIIDAAAAATILEMALMQERSQSSLGGSDE